MKIKHKLFSSKSIASVDEKNRTAKYTISSDDVDRAGDIVQQDWQLDNYKNNPIVLWGHNPNQPDNVLGRCVDISINKEKDRATTTATVQFAEEGTSKGVDTVWSLVKQGILRTVSVGFIPHKIDQDKDGNSVLKENELLEFSIVPIPANPNAVALGYKEFLAKSLNDTLNCLTDNNCDIIKKSTELEPIKKEITHMSDEDLKKIVDGVGESLTPKFDELIKAVQDLSQDKPSEDTDTDTETEKGLDLDNLTEKQAEIIKARLIKLL